MLSLYRAWLGPGPCVPRPGPPPGALRPVPRRAAPPPPSPPGSPASSGCSELDVERVDEPRTPGAELDVAACDGPVRFSRVPNAAWRGPGEWGRRKRAVQSYPCKSCGGKFPSYYFVHKHRKRCHADEPEPSTSAV